MPSFLLDTLKQAMASKSVLAFLDFQNISSWRQTTLGIGIVAVLYNPIIQLLILVTSDTQTSKLFYLYPRVICHYIYNQEMEVGSLFMIQTDNKTLKNLIE